MRVLMVMGLLLAGSASAQTMVSCSSNCPSRYYWERQPCTGGSCGRSYAPLPTEFMGLTPKGLSLASAYQGAFLELCADYGQTLTGTGTVRIWTWDPSLRSEVLNNPQTDLNVSDVWRSRSCSYTTQSDGSIVSGVGAGPGGVNISYDCRCIHWGDQLFGGYSLRRVVAQAIGVGVSGGSNVELHINGLETLR